MKALDRGAYWDVPLEGEVVARCYIDEAFALELGEKARRFLIRIEGDFSVTSSGERIELSPRDRESLGSALGLYGKTVRSCKASKGGALDVEFGDGSSLHVEPNTNHEAWELSGEGGLRLAANEHRRRHLVVAKRHGQLERQNREHRAWLDAHGPLPAKQAQAACSRMLDALNRLWRRHTLSWRTAEELWKERQPVQLNRSELRAQVRGRAARIRRHSRSRGIPADLVERLAIEQTLTERGLLRRQPRGWC
jgi:hypothetical protein